VIMTALTRDDWCNTCTCPSRTLYPPDMFPPHSSARQLPPVFKDLSNISLPVNDSGVMLYLGRRIYDPKTRLYNVAKIFGW